MTDIIALIDYNHPIILDLRMSKSPYFSTLSLDTFDLFDETGAHLLND